MQYPFLDRTVVMTMCDRICLDRRKISVSTVLGGQKVGIKQVDDQIWQVSFMEYDLGYFDMGSCRIEPVPNPFGPKLLTLWSVQTVYSVFSMYQGVLAPRPGLEPGTYGLSDVSVCETNRGTWLKEDFGSSLWYGREGAGHLHLHLHFPIQILTIIFVYWIGGMPVLNPSMQWIKCEFLGAGWGWSLFQIKALLPKHS